MFFFNRRQLTCPYCLVQIRGAKNLEHCLNPECGRTLPVQYLDEYQSHPPFFVQLFGWSNVGKTVFLDATTLMLSNMGNVWPRYAYSAVSDISQQRLQEINDQRSRGYMPDSTHRGDQPIHMILLHSMERWGGRMLVTRDCAGEVFDDLTIPIDEAPFLLNAPTTFMMISLPDMPTSGGKRIEMLMTNYINTLLHNRVNIKKSQRNIVVVLAKADMLLHELPPNLRRYLRDDPLWASVTTRGTVSQMDTTAMAEYVEIMGRVSNEIRDWLQQDASGRTFVRLAEQQNIGLRFCLVSSTGAAVDDTNTLRESLAPRRVLDPFFWALELQSRA